MANQAWINGGNDWLEGITEKVFHYTEDKEKVMFFSGYRLSSETGWEPGTPEVLRQDVAIRLRKTLGVSA